MDSQSEWEADRLTPEQMEAEWDHEQMLEEHRAFDGSPWWAMQDAMASEPAPF